MTIHPTRGRVAGRTLAFTESVIREMTRIAREHGAINLAQGFPDFPAPQVLKEAAVEAVRGDLNQYAITWGSARLRAALEAKYLNLYGIEVDGTRELTVTCGATEAMAAVMLALVDPGDEVIVLEPFYENYGPDAILSQAKPVLVPLDPPGFRLDPQRLRAAVGPRTRAVILNTPNNPTGRVFDPDEIAAVAQLATEEDFFIITDEIYEHILYEGTHHCLAADPALRDRVVVVSGFSKTFSVTGWRVGTILAPPDLTAAIRKVHDFLTVGAPAPLQEACAVGLETLGPEYYAALADGYRERRSVLLQALDAAGFAFTSPEGAYYVLADFRALGGEDDVAFSRRLTREAGVAPVPGSSFFSRAESGRELVRFAFCKRIETLEDAGERLVRFARAGG